MPRRQLKQLTARLAPYVDRVTANPWVRRYVPGLADPDLWHINRRSCARGVAVGLFAGLVPGPLQIAAAIGLALLVRANFPIAAVTTFYSNPLTIVPLYLIAWRLGALVLPDAAAEAAAPPPFSWSGGYLGDVLDWMGELGKPLAVGLPVLALTLAAAGWLLVHASWRLAASIAWRRRQRDRTGTRS